MNDDKQPYLLAAIVLFPLIFYLLGSYLIGEQMEILNNEWPNLFGNKTDSFLDLWSLQHLLAGILIGAIFTTSTDFRPSWSWLTAVFAIILLWEVEELGFESGNALLEHYLPFLISDVEGWFDGVEHWSNRLIADPMLVYLGAFGGRILVIKRKIRTLLVIGLLVGIFAIANLLAPGAMSIQEYLF